MATNLQIIKSNDETFLCFKNGDNYVDISLPMNFFTEGKDKFEIIPPCESYQKKSYKYDGRKIFIEPAFYSNNWPAINIANGRRYVFDTLTVNLVKEKAFDIPSKIFVDSNNYPDAMQFLIENGLAKDSGYRKQNDLVEHPMLLLNLPLLYQHQPKVFEEHFKKINRAKNRKMKNNIDDYLLKQPTGESNKKGMKLNL